MALASTPGLITEYWRQKLENYCLIPDCNFAAFPVSKFKLCYLFFFFEVFSQLQKVHWEFAHLAKFTSFPLVLAPVFAFLERGSHFFNGLPFYISIISSEFSCKNLFFVILILNHSYILHLFLVCLFLSRSNYIWNYIQLIS